MTIVKSPVEEIRQFLMSVKDRPASIDIRYVKNSLLTQKADAVARNEQALAKHLWCLDQILTTQDLYLAAFKQMQTNEFYRAWCTLEQVEVTLGFLGKHMNSEEQNRYSTGLIAALTSKYQALFPYRVFFSTEFIEKTMACSICKQKVEVRNGCGHMPGEIYNGELCSRIVTDLEFIGVSFVKTPRHKYAVPFVAGEDGKWLDHYDYSVLRYIVRRLKSAFDEWDFTQTTRRIPHENFNVNPSDPCPCRSGEPYEKCCLQTDGVSMPHYDIHFHSSVDGSLLTEELHLDQSIASETFLTTVRCVDRARLRS